MSATQPFRAADGGLIDRSRPLAFTFNAKAYQGFEGDTLASALLANGVRLVARSFKYHRPRGIFAAGSEEPNALVQLGAGTRTEPNVRATQCELFDGLQATSQNCWPSVGFDLNAAIGRFSRLTPAGFYYKTFKWPAGLWMTYEKVIRRIAGMGLAPREPDPDRYAQRYAHCDVLVAGGGPAGLAAALAAGRTGARVILADEDVAFGGSLLGQRAGIDDAPALDWVRATVAKLEAMPEVTLLTRSTVFGYYDHNMLAIAERVADHLPEPGPCQPRQRLWLVRARQVVLATGAIERPLVFADNDRPGVMLASAARAYLNRYAVRPGERAVVFTNNDSAYTAALDLAAAGIEIAAVVDVRADGGGAKAAATAGAGIACRAGHAVVATLGGRALAAVEVAALGGTGGALSGSSEHIACDLLCVSGGWSPTVHLFSQSRGRVAFDEGLAAFVPGRSVQAERSAGAAKGSYALGACLREGLEAGAAAAAGAEFGDGRAPEAPRSADDEEHPTQALWTVPAPKGTSRKRFVDLHNDVTEDDLKLAFREGYRSIELVKRYTATGMGTDQGKTSNVNALAIIAGVAGVDIPSVGTTTFRPPYTPVTMGALVGPETGGHYEPVRRSSMHRWHKEAGAEFITAGLWLRPRHYPRTGENVAAATNREVLTVRGKVGVIDVTTLGKIDIQGRDAAELLNRVYINGWSRLPVGRARYGAMLREDGHVFDDGTTTRIAENRYVMTTTTANAVHVTRHLEYYLHTVWPELDVQVISVTEEWAAMALAGPLSRSVLGTLTRDIDVSNEAFPFMGFREGTVAGAPARVFRISYSGEMAYEINVPSNYGLAVWEAILDAGEAGGITAYGTEAMEVMRIEKGHIVVGREADGRATPDDLELGRLKSKTKDYIGKPLLARPGLAADDRKQLIGLIPVDRKTEIPRGAQIVADPHHAPPNPMLGHITARCYSPNLKTPIALAMVAHGRAIEGTTLYAASPLAGTTVPVTVTGTVFIDPEGERLRA